MTNDAPPPALGPEGVQVYIEHLHRRLEEQTAEMRRVVEQQKETTRRLADQRKETDRRLADMQKEMDRRLADQQNQMDRVVTEFSNATKAVRRLERRHAGCVKSSESLVMTAFVTFVVTACRQVPKTRKSARQRDRHASTPASRASQGAFLLDEIVGELERSTLSPNGGLAVRRRAASSDAAGTILGNVALIRRAADLAQRVRADRATVAHLNQDPIQLLEKIFELEQVSKADPAIAGEWRARGRFVLALLSDQATDTVKAVVERGIALPSQAQLAGYAGLFDESQVVLSPSTQSSPASIRTMS